MAKDLAHNLGFNVVAEGVETIEEGEQLKAWGCEFAQGYLYAKPVDKDAAWQFMVKNLANQCQFRLRQLNS